MIISDSKKFIFIHIYKTGGNSLTKELIKYARTREKISGYWPTRKIIYLINKLLGLQGAGSKWINGVHKHAKAIDIRQYIGENKYNEYITFSIVRNPYDLLVSLYHYIKQSPQHKEFNLVNKFTFKEFVLREIENKAPRQSDFLTDENENIICDYIGKIEELDQFTKNLFLKLNLDFKGLEHTNKSKRKSCYIDYYDDELREKVNQYFRKDFELLGYDF